jgi:putative transposase
LRLFILQVLHGNTSITHLRQLSGIDFAPASYCQARRRLPLTLLESLLGAVAAMAQPLCPGGSARRAWIVDSSNFSMGDFEGLGKRFGYPPRVKKQIGYPGAKVLGLMDLATGMFVKMITLPLLAGDSSGMLQLHPLLRAGDILLGDRLYGGYAQMALLQARGVFACVRLHQQRKKKSGLQRWNRPSKKQAPGWMSLHQFLQLPPQLTVRVVRHVVPHKGFRSREIFISTTLLDEKTWPDRRLAELYGQRWRIETCFNHLKTTMKMNVLKGKSTAAVLKELAVYLLVYNLVRLVMLKAAAAQQVDIWRISFIDALRWLCCQILGLTGVRELIVNPKRPGRFEPRVVRRRPKQYRLMTRPRKKLKALILKRHAR